MAKHLDRARATGSPRHHAPTDAPLANRFGARARSAIRTDIEQQLAVPGWILTPVR